MKEAYSATHGKYARTFPAWFPLLPLDRIYVRGFEIKEARILGGSPWSGLSDHLALYAELKI